MVLSNGNAIIPLLGAAREHDNMNLEQAKIGLIGLGTMGAALALNIAEKGFPIAVYNRTTETIKRFIEDAGKLSDNIIACDTLEALVAAIKPPRMIILMVPAGMVVDQQIDQLKPFLQADDLIIDAGNANFHDTNRRAEAAKKAEYEFMGIGVSGGEEGARHGPSIMGGGGQANWQRAAPILEAIAAKYEDGTACATWMGERGAGHFVKMVHNGIEYADMQMIAEIYGILRDGYGYSAEKCAEIFEQWNKGPLKSYLIEISGEVMRAIDPEANRPVLDIILDKAGQKGTGRWTVIEAQHLGAPVSVIEAAVSVRNISARKAMREAGEATFGRAAQELKTDPDEAMLEAALTAGKILCYAQGFDLIMAGYQEFDWPLILPDIARVWRAGCIIRSAMLNDMAKAFEAQPKQNLIFDMHFSNLLRTHNEALRQVVTNAIANGHSVPALSAGLSWFDQMRTARSSANLIQAQRDFFGAHSFERIDHEGKYHGPWARI